MRRRATRAGMLGLVACVLVLSGCASSSSSKAAPTQATVSTAGATGAADAANRSKAAFIVSADAVCRRLRASLGHLAGQTKALSVLGDTPAAFTMAARLFRRVQSLEQAELRELRSLRLPTTGGALVTTYFRQGATAVVLLGRLADAFVRRDKAAVAALVRDASRMAATTKGLAQGYGFRVCGSGAGGNGLS